LEERRALNPGVNGKMNFLPGKSGKKLNFQMSDWRTFIIIRFKRIFIKMKPFFVI